jgi:hydrogenase nickel incorporation protein HypA/HybF
MHELSVTENIIRIAKEEAEKHNAVKVKEIRIKVGELSGLIPECIQFYFDIASEGTIAEGAVIKIEKIRISTRCNDCGFEEVLPSRRFNCSKCESFNIKIIGGNEFLIDSLEVE